MGIWDNLKDRLGIGGRAAGYDQGDFGDDYEYDAYHDSYPAAYIEDSYYDEGELPYDEHATTHAPLINMTDIRSQPVTLSRGAGSREDRIAKPIVRERRAATVSGLADEDSEAFRDSLARSSQNSLVQLHTERIQLEANAVPEFSVPDSSRNRRSNSLSEPLTAAERYNSGLSRGNAGAVIPRKPRQIEVLRPQSYADAEQISISLRHGSAVVLDLTNVRPELAKRILDFSFGVTSAFEGTVDRYADRVYILTRNGILSDVEKSQIRL